MNELEKPGYQLDEYRFKLAQARRLAIHERLDDLVSMINEALVQISASVTLDSTDRVEDLRTKKVEESISEIERLLGDTTDRKGRWGDLHRHLHYSQGHDWYDIAQMDWPSVRADIEAASLGESDPLPVPAIDIGIAATAKPAGSASIGLNWKALDDDKFERLLFDLLKSFPNYQNTEWLTKTRAPDRGRDLSAERVIKDDGGTTRIERVIVQAKHWTSKSVAPNDIMQTLSALELWGPPVIRALVIATSGRFTTDAVAIAEKHNSDGKLPFIELWADSRLETLLSQRPGLVANYGLRA
jgi:hypothetical protein